MPNTYKLKYTNARAWAEQIRFLFAYNNQISYEDIRLDKDALLANTPSFVIWDEIPEPVLEDGDLVLGQYNVITRYLGRKFGMNGDTEFEAAQCEEIVEALNDLRKVAKVCWFEQDVGRKAELRKEMITQVFPKYFQVWNQLVKKNGGFLVGNRFSYADFSIATRTQSYQNEYGSGIMDAFPELQAHAQGVFNAPGIKEWIAQRPQTQY